MKKRFLSVILALILCLSLTVTAFAAPVDTFVVDEFDILADAEIDVLNDQAAEIYDACGVGVFFVFTTADNLSEYDVKSLVGGMENYFVMLENDTSWYTFLGGTANDYIDEATETYLRDVYDLADTYVGGISDFFYAAMDCFTYAAETPEAEAPQAGTANSGEYFVYDEAQLLSDTEETALEQKLMNISKEYNAQVVVATVGSLEGANVDTFVEYLYDTMGFGYGEGHDGVLLLVCMDPREYRILSNGKAGDAISLASIDAIGEAIVDDLSDGDYADAFDAFADKCDYYLDGYTNGYPFRFGKNLLIALVIGLGAGLLIAFILKGQLKTVRKQEQADVYVKPGSMNITYQFDQFLYSNVTRTKKSNDNNSGGGGSRNVGGGSF